MNPAVTVLMPVYNNAPYIKDAVGSILSQSMTDFELLVIDDGSTDGSAEVLEAFRDPRLKVARNAENLGVARTLNRGLDMARGDYVARMDGDDISLPRRLERQVDFLENNPDVGVCGTWAEYFGEGRPFTARYPTGAQCVSASMLFSNPLAHGSVMIRFRFLEEHGLRFDEKVEAAQDFDLWARCRGKFDIDNLPEVLLRYRVHGMSVTSNRTDVSRRRLLHVLSEGLAELGVRYSKEELLFHAEVGNGSGMFRKEDVLQAARWLGRLGEANGRKNVYTEKGFAGAAGRVWFRLCRNSSQLGPWVWKTWRGGAFRKGYHPFPAEQAAFLASIASSRMPGGGGGFPQGRMNLTGEPGER
jgi:glycosyltransferase involved in cell wall biosynthesis